VGGVPARGARRVRGQAVAGTLSASLLTVGALSVALVVAVGATVAAPAGLAAATSPHAKTIKVSTAKVPNVGTVLATASGLTLYRFTEDTPGTSKCTGACAKIWPPMLASKGAHVSGPRGVKGLAVMKVGDGHYKVTFHKIPLYRFAGDKKKGQANGQNVGKVWFAVLKSGIPATTTAAGTPTPTTAPAPATTQPTTAPTPTTQTHSSAGSNSTTPTQTPATMAPAPPPPPPPPSTTPRTTPPTAPPTTTTTAPVMTGGGTAF
jgi:predicted lipoprotein with Yx(FWY)xxD motif